MKIIHFYSLLLVTALFSSGCSTKLNQNSDTTLEDTLPSLTDKSVENNFVFDINKIKNCPDYSVLEQKQSFTEKNAYVKAFLSNVDEDNNSITSAIQYGDLETNSLFSVKLCKNKQKQIEIKTINSTKEELK